MEGELQTDQMVLDNLVQARKALLGQKKAIPPEALESTLERRIRAWRDSGVPENMINAYIRLGARLPGEID